MTTLVPRARVSGNHAGSPSPGLREPRWFDVAPTRSVRGVSSDANAAHTRVRSERPSDGVLLITLDDPERLNATGAEGLAALQEKRRPDFRSAATGETGAPS